MECMSKKYFLVSLCENGIIGGIIIADSEVITYKSGKVTIPKEYKNLEIKYSDIANVSMGRLLVFPTVTVKMKLQKEFKFVVFARKRFMELLKSKEIEKLIYDK